MFDNLDLTSTQEELHQRIAWTQAKKAGHAEADHANESCESLLLVLKYPDLALLNDAAEL